MMKQLVIISGKGGTGKTIISGSLAVLAKNKVMVDCDVDAANLHLLLHPKIKERHEFRGGDTAYIDQKICKWCNRCLAVCRYEAISDDFVVDPISCEGCGLCSRICPENAISMEENIAGEWFISDTKYGPFVHARLGIAEENSGKLVTKIRQTAKELAEKERLDYVIIDGPPGIGCAVIASMANVDFALIVTEPTLAGMHDLQRVADLARHFGIQTKVIINKFDINLKNTEDIGKICQKRNIEVIVKLPFSEDVHHALVKGMPVVEFCQGRITKDIADLWKKINQ
jgi:MinD superfamily P-loop ATPase